MMPYKDQEKAKESNKQRQKRYRETHQNNAQPKLEITPVTPDITPIVTPKVTTVTSKAECNCRYYRLTDGLLVCIQCGRPALVRKDGLSRGLANGSPWLR